MSRLMRLNSPSVDNTYTSKVFIWIILLPIAAYLTGEIVRRFFDVGMVSLLLFDVSLILCYLVFLFLHILDPKCIGAFNRLPAELKLFIPLLILLLIVSVLNIYYPSTVLSVLSLRTYLLGLPMIVIGFVYADRIFSSDGRRIDKFLNNLCFIVVLLALLQFLGLDDQIPGLSYFKPLEHSVHSYGNDEVSLISSLFASSKRYARFLLFSYILVWCIRSHLKMPLVRVTLLYMLGVALSGSREALVLFVLFQLVVMWGVSKPGKSSAINKVFVLMLISLTTMSLIFLSDYSTRLSFLFSLDDFSQYVRRVYAFFPIFFVEEGKELYFGIGAAHFGQEVKVIPHLKEVVAILASDTFDKGISVNGNNVIFDDAGLTKLFIEFGFLGMLVFILPMIYFLRAIYAVVFPVNDKRVLGLSFGLVIWLVLFLKSHVILSEAFYSYFLYLFIGMRVSVLSAGRGRL